VYVSPTPGETYTVRHPTAGAPLPARRRRARVPGQGRRRGDTLTRRKGPQPTGGASWLIWCVRGQNVPGHRVVRQTVRARWHATCVVGTVSDLQTRPMYGFAIVDDVLALRSGTAARWINGYDRGGRHSEPVIRPETTGSEIATWGEIVESRLLAEYRSAGVPIINLRPVVNRLRRMLETPYPLASARLWLTPEGKDIVAEAQAGLPGGLWLVRTGEDLLPLDWTPPAKRFQSQVHWDSEGALAPSYMYPARSRLIVVDPDRGFGEPVLKGRGVPTRVIAELRRAGDSVEMIAELYELTTAQVRAAVAFEKQSA